jgi:uroporphyrinogen decarboxylase
MDFLLWENGENPFFPYALLDCLPSIINLLAEIYLSYSVFPEDRFFWYLNVDKKPSPAYNTQLLLPNIIISMISKKRLIGTLQGNKSDRIPFWFMRQAGRYLPEYKALRSRTKNFLEFCYSPEKAAEATLQPLHRFGMDGAIIFSDILVIPHALGMDVCFEEGKGPVLSPVRNEKSLEKLQKKNLGSFLSPVYEALSLVKKSLPDDAALIGFIGAPWTLACYAVNGGASEDFKEVKNLAKTDERFFSSLIHLFTKAAGEHAIRQIEAGAEVIQIFDSWAGIASDGLYEKYVIEPAKTIVKTIKARHKNVPIIGFPRQSGNKFLRYVQETGVDAVNFDGSVPFDWVKRELQPLCAVQGALNPELLADDKTAMLTEAKTIVDILDKPFVFNLGHGILPHTPIENMQALCDFLKRT